MGIPTLISHGNDVKMFKTQMEPQAAGEWFHCKAGCISQAGDCPVYVEF